MTTPLSLLSLNEDILREILSHLLLDTPRETNRASILQTCSLLHDLGLPLLYRIVDLAGMESRFTVIIHWKRLFGLGGLFAHGTKSTRGFEVGSFVRELRLGGGDHYEQGRWEGRFSSLYLPSCWIPSANRLLDLLPKNLSLRSLLEPDFQTPSLLLPVCSTLFFDCINPWQYEYPTLKYILSQLPITHLVVTHRGRQTDWGDSFPVADFSHGWTLGETLGFEPQPWESLETIIFHGCLWRDDLVTGSAKVSCSALSFKTLVVEVPATKAQDLDRALKLFLEPKLKEGERFLEDAGRIEFRISGEFANEMEEKFREEARKRVARGLSSLEKRLLPLFVFVSEDGSERRFEDVE